MHHNITANRITWGIIRAFTALSLALSWVATIPPTPVAALGNIVIANETPIAVVRNNTQACTTGPTSMYIEVEVRNTLGSPQSNLTATLEFLDEDPPGNWTGIWHLDDTESP